MARRFNDGGMQQQECTEEVTMAGGGGSWQGLKCCLSDHFFGCLPQAVVDSALHKNELVQF